MSLLKRNLYRIFIQTNNIILQQQTSRNYNAKSPTSGSTIKCTLIPGDGVGPELLNSVNEVFKAASVPVEFETIFFSEEQSDLSAPLKEVVSSIKKNRICLKGIVGSPEDKSGELETMNVKLRRRLDLYANIVHVRSLDGVVTRQKGIDLVVVREQTEGEYSGFEHECVPGVVECLKIVTAVKSERIAKFAFDWAMKNDRKKVTCVHKANIMKLGDGLFMRSCQQIAKLYPNIKFETMIVDNTTMQLVSAPEQFDVMVMPNLYGSIIANSAAGLVGGAGVVSGASYSPDCAIFEPGARHTYEIAAGKNRANPTAMLLCGAKMLSHLNLDTHSALIKNSVEKVLRENIAHTVDLGGTSSTTEFTKAVIDNLGVK